MPASGPASGEKMFPAAVLEDQEAIMAGENEPVVVGIPPFSSPDPGTDGIRMMSLTEEGPAAEAQKAQAAKAEADAVPDEDKKATDWKAVVEAAQTEDELSEVEDRYNESGADFKSVDDAIEKRLGQIREQEEQSGQEDENNEEEA